VWRFSSLLTLGVVGLACLVAGAGEVSSSADNAETKVPGVQPASPAVPRVAPIDPALAVRVRALTDTARERGVEELKSKRVGAAATDAGRAAGEPFARTPEQGAAPVQPAMSGRLVVALSSSMPMPMVQAYMAQLAGVPEAIVVLRGFVGGARTVAPTGKWVEEARRVEPSCLRCEHYNVQVVVDPLVYRGLHIEQVPAVAFIPGISDLSHCDGQQLQVKSMVYGAVSIESAVQALTNKGESIPTALLEKVRRKGWELKTPKHSG
jgi:Type-F conjugative transfer system pilin assembly protein